MAKPVFVFPLLLLIGLSFLSQAQVFPAKPYPQRYFQWPVTAVHALAANFGEIRNNHFHMGLDCKTDQHENVPVLAADDGYIAKVKIEPFGFGRCIYINHPNGYTTLYAHLNAFFPALEKYITDRQYQLQSWKLFIDLPPNLFPVKKGALIANSGNTGGSQGPHTHFEIRNTLTDKVLNPLLFDFGLADQAPPEIFHLAIYDRRKSTYEQTPRLFSVKKINGVYTTVPALILLPTDKVSFAIGAEDIISGFAGKTGIYQAILSDNNLPIIGFQMDNIRYDETRYLNAHIDYSLHSKGGLTLQHLSQLPGYNDGIYTQWRGSGVIDLSANLIHVIQVEVTDANGNAALLKFQVQSTVSVPPMANHPAGVTVFRPGLMNVFENEKIRFHLPENGLYDYFAFQYNESIPASGLPIFQLHNTSVPVQVYFPIAIKNTTTAHPDKLVMHRFAGGKNDYAKTTNRNGWFSADFRAFGSFQLIEDLEPPVISPIGFKEGMNVRQLNRLAFVVTDNTEEVNFKASLDGQWLLFSNDKGKNFVYTFDGHCPSGAHELTITATDCVGNTTQRVYHFSR